MAILRAFEVTSSTWRIFLALLRPEDEAQLSQDLNTKMVTGVFPTRKIIITLQALQKAFEIVLNFSSRFIALNYLPEFPSQLSQSS
jgi:hypothetical protein